MPAAERNPRQTDTTESPLTNERVRSPAGAAHIINNDRSTLGQQSTGLGEPWAEGSG